MAQLPAGTFPPQQQRTREGLARALRAGVELLEVGDYAAFTMSEVAARADVSVTSLYRRFENKDALFDAVHAAALEEMQALTDELFARPLPATLSDREVVAEVVARAATVFSSHSGKLRVMYLRGAGNAGVLARGQVGAARFGEEVIGALLTRRDAIQHPDPELAAQMCFRNLFATMMHWTVFGGGYEATPDPGWEVFVEEQTAMCVSYLLGQPA